MKTITLADAPSAQELQIIKINAADSTRKRLISMGLHANDKIVKYNNSSWCPVLLKNITTQSSKIAIGQRLAEKIMVSYEES